jgi:cysteinyl-tRNA synthetase
MALQLYNTLTRKKERFEPIDPANVRMYVCGPTVYDFAHIGNARPIIVFDVLFRLLRHIYGAEHVTYARNITDVDDKINNRAVERWPEMEPTAAIRRLTEETAAQFHKDIAALGVLEPTVEPRATEHIAEMRALCETLVANGHAYVAQEHVLFDAASMPDYGRLANRSLEEMEAGARVDVAPYKKGPMDFVLWKPSTSAQPGWPSPCGIAAPGRPGWHIECSAMADRWLWSEPKLRGLLTAAGLAHPHVFDIHGGGIDLVFPHHENEIAQSRCAHGTPVMANVWMHNGFLQVEGEKMSKSLGNFVTINELLATTSFGGTRWAGDVLRLTMLRTHYRQPIDWTVASLRENQRAWVSFGNAIRDVAESETHDERFLAALRDDLNTPEAMARLFVLRDQAVHGNMDSARKLRKAFSFFGFLRQWHFNEQITIPLDGVDWELDQVIPEVLRVNGDTELLVIAKQFEDNHRRESTHVVAYLRKFVPGTCVRDLRKISSSWHRLPELDSARSAARKRKDFKESDRIRDELAAMGIQLKDSKNKETGEIETTWEVKR